MKHQEDDLQLACVQWFTMQYPKLSRGLHHSPNGGRRNAREAARFKAAGVRPGFPDLALYLKVARWTGLAVELKIKPNTVKKGSDQEWWLEWLESQGWKTAVCYDLTDFMQVVEEYFL